VDEAELLHRLELTNEFEELFLKMVRETDPIKRIQLEGIMYERIKYVKQALEMRVKHELEQPIVHNRRKGDKEV